jgi:hypothetical protein
MSNGSEDLLLRVDTRVAMDSSSAVRTRAVESNRLQQVISVRYFEIILLIWQVERVSRRIRNGELAELDDAGALEQKKRPRSICL